MVVGTSTGGIIALGLLPHASLARASLSVLDSKTHWAVAHYNGIRLTVE